MARAQLASSHLIFRVVLTGLLGGFLLPALVNDAKDFLTRIQGAPIPQCATWSLTRPPCRL
jgi:hypothetical protein